MVRRLLGECLAELKILQERDSELVRGLVRCSCWIVASKWFVCVDVELAVGRRTVASTLSV